MESIVRYISVRRGLLSVYNCFRWL